MFIPEEYIPDSLESYIHDLAKPVKVIYVTILLCIIVTILLLPIISVDVICQEQGIIRPLTEKAEITFRKMPLKGRLKKFAVKV